MKQYTITGMSCAACVARVEKAVAKVPGVESCAVSLLTNSMGVEGTAAADAVVSAVEAAGYGAAVVRAAAEAFAAAERSEGMLHAWALVMEMEGESAEALSAMALASLRLGARTEAEGYLERALALDGAHRRSRELMELIR